MGSETGLFVIRRTPFFHLELMLNFLDFLVIPRLRCGGHSRGGHLWGLLR
jgi:hypothetical protein